MQFIAYEVWAELDQYGTETATNTLFFFLFFFLQTGISSFFRNVATYLPDYIASRLIFEKVETCDYFL